MFRLACYCVHNQHMLVLCMCPDASMWPWGTGDYCVHGRSVPFHVLASAAQLLSPGTLCLRPRPWRRHTLQRLLQSSQPELLQLPDSGPPL